jgi:hypothetical protein
MQTDADGCTVALCETGQPQPATYCVCPVKSVCVCVCMRRGRHGHAGAAARGTGAGARGPVGLAGVTWRRSLNLNLYQRASSFDRKAYLEACRLEGPQRSPCKRARQRALLPSSASLVPSSSSPRQMG